MCAFYQAPPINGNFMCIRKFCNCLGGLFSSHSQVTALLIWQSGVWKRKVSIGIHMEECNRCCGEHAWGIHKTITNPDHICVVQLSEK